MCSENESSRDILSGFIESLNNRDMEKALSFFDENAEWITPEGKFTGRGELGPYLKWFGENILDVRVADRGLISQGRLSACEMVLEGNSEGENWEVTALSICELTDARIIYMRTVYDRLGVAKQVAREGLAGLAVSKIVERMEEGLH